MSARQSSYSKTHYQRGVVLIVALVILVAMTLMAIALTRSVDFLTQIAGNLGYRQAGVQSSDAAVELARDWLMKQGKTNLKSLENDIPNSYFSTWNGGASGAPAVFDPTTFDWSKATKTPATGTDIAGNVGYYVVHRMCGMPGDPSVPATNCFTAPTSTQGGSNTYGGPPALSFNPYYRITVRVVGPKNTTTYTQVVIY